jgi:hypothetical protein
MNDKGPQSGETPGNASGPAGSLNPIFASLVQAEDDTVGLLAYALYKQNKRDWLTSFFEEQGREATPGELLAYHLGERSPRRVLTYRRLAVDILAKDPGGRDGEGLAGNLPGFLGSGKAAGPPSHTEVITSRAWSKFLVAVLAVMGLLAIIVVALSFVSPGLIRDILPVSSTSPPNSAK